MVCQANYDDRETSSFTDACSFDRVINIQTWEGISQEGMGRMTKTRRYYLPDLLQRSIYPEWRRFLISCASMLTTSSVEGKAEV